MRACWFWQDNLAGKMARVYRSRICLDLLNEHDNDLPVFVHAIASSLQTVFPDACQNTASLLKARQLPLTYQLATLIINDLADLPQDVILVLDDYHLIHTSEISQPS